MIIGVRSWELHLPGAHSLKDKRSVVKSLKDRLHNEFNVSVAETAHHDAWQRAELTACLVSVDRRHAESVLAAADRLVESAPFCRIIDSATSFL
ncbi:MAG TPA: DUF503 domain-containing protein [Gemmatimonadaceae bacterium]|nr:DUF503 domain-containing protein [Gemmatimonadaceae bacterium]